MAGKGQVERIPTSEFITRESGQPAKWQSIFPSAPFTPSAAREGNSQKSYVPGLLLWAGCGCQGKHITLHSNGKANNITGCLYNKADLSTVHGDSWQPSYPWDKVIRIVCFVIPDEEDTY